MSSPFESFRHIPSSDEPSAPLIKAEAADLTLATIFTSPRKTRGRVKVETSPIKLESITIKKETIKKKRKGTRPYADPSFYAHLPQTIPDHLTEYLTLLICGLNPGVMTAQTGHHFASPTNLFWPLLYESRIIGRRMIPAESHLLVSEWNIGITNLVTRPTAEAGELSKAECVDGAHRVLNVVKQLKPRAVLFTGKGIWEAAFAAIHKRNMKKDDDFCFGWQKENVVCDDGSSTRIFVTMGTSGRVAAYSPAYKREVFQELGNWMQTQR